jgi:hypothetical protein
LVRLHGDGQLLDGDEFAESGIRVATAAVWLDRPLVDAPSSAQPPIVHTALFRTYRGDEVPVVVARPYLTRGAALATPVQIWRDPWRTEPRVLRYRAQCVVCTRPVWGFDDGENDPRGVLGNNSAGWSIDPFDDDIEGTPVGVCAVCGNDASRSRRAHGLARELWTHPAKEAGRVPLNEPRGPAPTGQADQLTLEL